VLLYVSPTGKTTLSHVLARHVGYNPVEVNGSDDRSAQFLRERIAALESNRIDFQSSRDRRPSCLILDEIDGVDSKGAIEALVDIVKADIPHKSHKKKGLYLRRPLILICNNKYAPALRPILSHCRHFNLAAPSQVRLISRLRACLQEEHLVVSGTSVLHQLGSVAGGDIRSCLHTLQFVASRARWDGCNLPSNGNNDRDVSQGRKAVDVSKSIMEALASGQKDVRTDVASIVTAVFRKEKPKLVGSKNQKSVGKVLRAVEVRWKSVDCGARARFRRSLSSRRTGTMSASWTVCS
jgi:chromosome transmission fidelity protein 18